MTDQEQNEREKEREKEREREREREREAEALAELLKLLAQIWEDHLPILYAHLNRKGAPPCGSDTDGILSAARERLLRRRPILRFESIPEAIDYLRQAADSEVADRVRKIAERVEPRHEQSVEPLAAHVRRASSPEDIAIQKEELRQRGRFVSDCRVAIDRLTPKLRAVVELRWLSDARPKFREIGERLGISEEAARKRHERALAKLRGYLDLK